MVLEDGSSRKSSRPFDESGSHSVHNVQRNSDGCNSPEDKKVALQGIPWKDFSLGKEESAMGRKKQGEPTGPVRKSKRVPKRRVFDGEYSEEDDDDDEIRYLEKLKLRPASVRKEDVEGSGRRQRKPSEVSNGENSGKGKARSDQGSEDMDYEEEKHGSVSENDNEGGNENGLKKQQKESVDSIMESKREMTLTSRQRAITSGSDGSIAIEFPDGLPPPSRRKKEKLTEVEERLKKANAAQRRKLQTEKAARESEAEAIRKILGQESSRKKREDKIKKRQEELAQEKIAHEERAATSYIRTIMGPNGTTVSFPEDKVPSLLESKPVSYPPPREKCVGPSCTNPYKYRDSRTKLPLCSLQCYKAVQQQHAPDATG